MFCFDCIRETLAPRSKKYKIKLRFWNDGSDALCESLILGSEKFYCPFKDCSALLVNDGGGAVTSSECPHCNRLFCAQCKVTWHSGICCSEYQSLRKDERDPSDLMLMDLAKNNKWKRCPNCNFYVEKIDGCDDIHCRCGHDFDYNTGSYLSMSEEEEEEEDEEEENWIYWILGCLGVKFAAPLDFRLECQACANVMFVTSVERSTMEPVADPGLKKGLRSFTVRLKIVLLVDDDGGTVTSSECPHCAGIHFVTGCDAVVTEDAETVGPTLKLRHMVRKIQGTVVSSTSRTTKEFTCTISKVKPSNAGVDSLSVLYDLNGITAAHHTNGSSSISKSDHDHDDDYDDDDDDDDQYFPPRMDHRDYDDLHVPPLMERNDADDPYIQPLIHYGDQIFHKYDDDNDDDDDDDDQYFTPRSSPDHKNFENTYVPPLMKCNDAGDPYIRPLEEQELESWMKFRELADSLLHVKEMRYPIREEDLTTVKKDDNLAGFIGEYVVMPLTSPVGEELIRWEIALCESMILGSQKFYCPFKDCSALLVDDGRQTVTSSECPNCNRLLIATDCLCESMMARGDGLQAVSDGHKGIMEEPKERPNEPEMSDNKNSKHLDKDEIRINNDITWFSSCDNRREWKKQHIKNVEKDLGEVDHELPKTSVPRTDVGFFPVTKIEIRSYWSTASIPMETLVHRIQHGNNKRADKAKLYNEIRNVNDTIDACREPAEPDDDPDPSGRYGWNWRPNHDKRNKQCQLKKSSYTEYQWLITYAKELARRGDTDELMQVCHMQLFEGCSEF
ncbi:zinc finger, C6HC-type containing protein [Tanacetum coccineum]